MEQFAKIETVIGDLDKLPTLPGIAIEILRTVRDADAGVKEIGDIIAKDLSLSTEILKTVNSSYYGLQGKVASIPHAVGLLGATTVKNLALGFSLLRANRYQNAEHFDCALFWKGSLIGAVAAQELARDLLPELAEEAFIIGLLQDIGTLALLKCMPDQFRLVLKEVQTTECPFHEAEVQILGFTHMEFGAYLIKTWGLPELVYEPIGYHHHADRLPSGIPELKTMTRILDLSAAFIDLFLKPSKTIAVGIIEYQARIFNFQDRIALDRVAEKIQHQTQAIFPMFEIEFDREDSYTDIIDQARSELIKLSQQFVTTLARQKQEIENLREQVTRDSMTGLINYRRFMELLEQEIYRVRRYHISATVVLADIDHFKVVNDTYGHQAGDMVLTHIAQKLGGCVRASDVVARYGGEEFGLILPETDIAGSQVIAERLRQAVEQMALQYEGASLQVTMSFGIANIDAFPNHSPRGMIREADRALYRAKSAGRNQCCLAVEENAPRKVAL